MRWRHIALALAMTSVVVAALAQEPQLRRVVAARVNGEPVHVAEAETELRRAYGEREFSAEDRPTYLRAALDQVIDRRLILGYLTKTGQAASKQDIDLALAHFENDLKAQNLTLAEHLKQVG